MTLNWDQNMAKLLLIWPNYNVYKHNLNTNKIPVLVTTSTQTKFRAPPKISGAPPGGARTPG